MFSKAKRARVTLIVMLSLASLFCRGRTRCSRKESILVLFALYRGRFEIGRDIPPTQSMYNCITTVLSFTRVAGREANFFQSETRQRKALWSVALFEPSLLITHEPKGTDRIWYEDRGNTDRRISYR